MLVNYHSMFLKKQDDTIIFYLIMI